MLGNIRSTFIHPMGGEFRVLNHVVTKTRRVARSDAAFEFSFFVIEDVVHVANFLYMPSHWGVYGFTHIKREDQRSMWIVISENIFLKPPFLF